MTPITPTTLTTNPSHSTSKAFSANGTVPGMPLPSSKAHLTALDATPAPGKGTPPLPTSKRRGGGTTGGVPSPQAGTAGAAGAKQGQQGQQGQQGSRGSREGVGRTIFQKWLRSVWVEWVVGTGRINPAKCGMLDAVYQAGAPAAAPG